MDFINSKLEISLRNQNRRHWRAENEKPDFIRIWKMY